MNSVMCAATSIVGDWKLGIVLHRTDTTLLFNHGQLIVAFIPTWMCTVDNPSHPPCFCSWRASVQLPSTVGQQKIFTCVCKSRLEVGNAEVTTKNLLTSLPTPGVVPRKLVFRQ